MDTLGDRLSRQFFARNTVTVARNLLGKLLASRLTGTLQAGRIVEVEAYRSADDPASHAYRGPTPRSKIMFAKPGVAYVYFTYGNHYCLNVTTEPVGRAGAVLIRALEPKLGLKQMMRRRKTRNPDNLTNGPGKLTRALGITDKQNGMDLTTSNQFSILDPKRQSIFETVSRTRIGIRSGIEKKWRFYIRDSPYVSRL